MLDVGGVGYEVLAPVGALGRAKGRASASGELTFYVHTHVREDALSLFGFATPEDKAAFRILILGLQRRAQDGARAALGH